MCFFERDHPNCLDALLKKKWHQESLLAGHGGSIYFPVLLHALCRDTCLKGHPPPPDPLVSHFSAAGLPTSGGMAKLLQCLLWLPCFLGHHSSLVFLVGFSAFHLFIFCVMEPELPLGRRWPHTAMLQILLHLHNTVVMLLPHLDPDQSYETFAWDAGPNALASKLLWGEVFLEVRNEFRLGLAHHGAVGRLAVAPQLPYAEGHIPGAMCLAHPCAPKTGHPPAAHHSPAEEGRNCSVEAGNTRQLPLGGTPAWCGEVYRRVRLDGGGEGHQFGAAAQARSSGRPGHHHGQLCWA